jgi:hypothetical protein
LRRVEALPRPDPLAEIGVPSPLRGPVRLAMPLGQGTLHPLAWQAAGRVQELRFSGAHQLELRFVPALHPDARSLEVTVTGPSGQASATVPLDWWECP